MSGKFTATVVIAIGIFLFLLAGFPTGHSSMFNVPWMVHYTNAIGWDAMLPRHLPGLWDGLGGYDFFFYAPVPFWIIAVFVTPICLGCGAEAQIVLGAALFWVLGGFTFYLFLSRYLDRRYAIIGAIAYNILPYHLWIDWYLRQAIGEFAAYAFIPLIAYGFDETRLNGQRGWAVSVGVAGAALCHLPTALLACHVFAAVTLVVVWQKMRHKGDTLRFLSAVIGWTFLGVFLSSFYWLPAVALLKTVSPDALYTSHFIAENWLFGLHFNQPSPSFAVIILGSFLTGLPFVLVSALTSRDKIRMWIVTPVIFSVLLNLGVSEPVWQGWIIQKVQFPWRLMVFVDFSAAIAVAFVFQKFAPFHRSRVLIALVLLAQAPNVIVGVPAMRSVLTEYQSNTDWTGAIEYLSADMQGAINTRLGLKQGDPVTRDGVAKEVQKITAEFALLPAQFSYTERAPRRITIVPDQDVPHLSLPLQYWVFWRAEMDANILLTLTANPHLGTIEVFPPPGGFQGRPVTLTLPYHSSEKIGFAISLLSLVLLLVAILKPPRGKAGGEDAHSPR